MSVYALVVGCVGRGFSPCRAPCCSMSFRWRCRACRALSPSCRHLARRPATPPPSLPSAMWAGLPDRRRDAASLVADGLFAPMLPHAVGGVASATVQACRCRSKRSRRTACCCVSRAPRRCPAARAKMHGLGGGAVVTAVRRPVSLQLPRCIPPRSRRRLCRPRPACCRRRRIRP